MNIKTAILNPIKNFYNKHFSTSLSKQGLSKWIEEFIIYIKDLKTKLTNLSETNYKLALFHYENGNINDAIFRFKILKLFKSGKAEVDYYLGCCYFEKFKYSKAVEYFDNYKSNSSNKYIDEITYYHNIIDRKYADIKEVSPSIIEHMLNQTIVKHEISEEEGLVYNDVVKYIKPILKNHAKPFDNNVLELGIESKYLGHYFRENKLVNYLVATSQSKKLINLIKDKHQDDWKIYNEILYAGINSFFISGSPYVSSKYDIIISLNALDFTSDIELIFKSVFNMLNKNSIFVISFKKSKNQDNVEFNYKASKFAYNKDYIIDFAKSHGYNLISTHDIMIRSQDRLLLIFTI